MARLGALIVARPAVALAAIISGIIGIGLLGVWIWGDALATDFSVYWRTANGTLSDVYSRSFEYPFPYAPTMLLWITPLSAVPMWPAFIFWGGLSIAAIIAASRPYLNRNELWLLCLCPPMMHCLLTGQVSVALTALMLWSFGSPNRLAAGVALGIVASVKPQLVAMAPLFLLFRADWRALAAAACAFLLIVATAILVFGQTVWGEWIASMEHFRMVLHREEIIFSAVTPAAAAESWGLPAIPFMLIGSAVGAWLVYRCRNLGPLETTAAVAAGSLLASPYALIYDLAAVAPFLVWSIFRGRFTSAVAISGVTPPIPLVLATFELLRQRQDEAPEEPVDGKAATVPC